MMAHFGFLQLLPFGLAASVAIGISTNAQAEDTSGGQQTVENAQKFLAMVLPTAGLETNNWHGRGRITSAAVKDRCQQSLVASFGAIGQYIAGTLEGSRSWGGIADVTATNNRVRVAYSDAAIVDTLSFTSDAMASRVAYALQFLKVECDYTAKLGF